MLNLRAVSRRYSSRKPAMEEAWSWLRPPSPFSGVRCKSSHDWLLRQARDPYVKKAQIVSYRARSAFKLLEIDERFKIFKPGQVIVDLGASPGSWSQVAVKKVNALVCPDSVSDVKQPKLVRVDKQRRDDSRGPLDQTVTHDLTPLTVKPARSTQHGLVVGVDLLDITPLDGAIFLALSDFTQPKVQSRISEVLAGRPVDMVMSDMAPNASGVGQLDHDRILQLCTEALNFSLKVLAVNGTFLCKIWTGQGDAAFRELLRKDFSLLRNVKPPASRGDSAELYLLATGFRKPSDDNKN